MSDRTEVQTPNDQGEYPIEPKVAAARIAAFVVALIAAFLLKTVPAMADILPFLQDWGGQLLTDILIGVFAFIAAWWAGYRARHVQRPTETGQPVVPYQGR
jgi:hypothetical protein